MTWLGAALALALLLAAGRVAARGVGLPGLEGALIAGYVLLLVVVQALCALGIELRASSAAVGLIVAAALTRQLGRTVGRQPDERGPAPAGWKLSAIVAIALAVSWRAGLEPLLGVDTPFRWRWLAERMLARGSLELYPPVTSAHFREYFWPDGIAPLVASGYWWLWAWAGEPNPRVTALLVGAQWLAACSLAARLGRRLSGGDGLDAALLLATCPALIGAFVIGQETGLLVVSTLATVHAALVARGTPGMLALGVSAALGALAREWGWVILLCGLAVAARRGKGGGDLLVAAGVCALLAGPWYLRNWVRTGNPLYDLPVLGLFPVNPAHGAILEEVGPRLALSADPRGNAGLALEELAATAALAALTGALAMLRGRGRALLGPALAIIAMWVLSVRYTEGGLVYSLRVLAPALALLAVAGGAGLSVLVRARRPLAPVAAAVLGLAAGWAVASALLFPARPLQVPRAMWARPLPVLVWGPHKEGQADVLARDLESALPAGARVLSQTPFAQPALLPRGVEVVPLWDPEVRFLMDASLSPAEVRSRLAAAGIGWYLRDPLIASWHALPRFPGLAAFGSRPRMSTRLGHELFTLPGS